jgi:hypothetical protein
MVDSGFSPDLSGLNFRKTPLTLGRWGQFLVDKSRRNAPQPILTKYSFDPRISQERYLQLKEAFDQIDTDHSGFISLLEIMEFLKQFSDELDEDYIRTIFESIDRNHDNQLSIEEFIEGYLEQVNGLTEAMTMLKNEQTEKTKHKEKLVKELEENLIRETINAHGIMEGSQLALKVVEAQNLNLGTGKPNPYVEIKCESQRIKTNVVQANRNPAWDEAFTFNIKIGTGEVLCSIFSSSQTTTDEIIGFCTVPLKELEDQLKHERWYSVNSKTSTGARLFLSMQWIHHKCDYLRRQILDWDESINTDSAELSRLEAELRKLGTSPLGLFIKDNWVTIWEKRLITAIDEFTDRHMSSFTHWEAARQVFLALFCVVTLFSCFYRPDFFNLALATLSILQEFIGWRQITLRAVIAGLFISFITDMLWLLANSDDLISEGNYLDSELHRFSYVMSLLSYVMKLPFMLTIVKTYVKWQDKSHVSADRSRQISINVSQVP